jgi:hypothetical protein
LSDAIAAADHEPLERVLRVPDLTQSANRSVRAVAFRRAQQTQGNRAAQRAMRGMPPTSGPFRRIAQRACACGGTCATCATQDESVLPETLPQPEDDESRIVQRRSRTPAAEPQDRSDPVDEMESSRGEPLDPQTRVHLEARFARDLSDVRVHTDQPAARAADTLQADAFTTGRSIYFADGQYAPASAEGRHLIAHEVAHTIQQSSGLSPSVTDASPSPGLVVGSPHDALEREADHAATIATTPSGGMAPAMSPDHSGVVRRQGVRRAFGDAWSATGGRAVRWAGEQVEAGLDWVRGWLEERAPWLMQLLRGDVVAMLRERLAASVDAFLGGFLSRVQREGIFGALSGLAAESRATLKEAWTAFKGEACAALLPIVEGLIGVQRWLNGKTFQTLKSIALAIAGFFSSAWDEIGAPAWKAIKSVASDVWEWIESQAARIWRTISPLFELGARVWAEVKRVLGVAWDSGAGILDWLKQKALAAWEKVKATIQPILGPLKVVGAALLLLSPLGPILLIGAAGVGLWHAITWLAHNWKTLDIVVRAQAVLREHILPAIRSGVAIVGALLQRASAWLSEQITRLLAGFGRLLDALGVTAFLSLAHDAVAFIHTKLAAFGEWIQTEFARLVDAVLPTLRKVWAFVQPIEIALLKLAIVAVNPMLWPIYLSAVVWMVLPECVKPPIIDYILDLLIGAIRAIPSFKSFGETWSQIQTGFLKGLTEARHGPMSRKLELSNRVANMIAGGTLEGYGNLIAAARQVPDRFMNEAESELIGINRGEPLPFERTSEPEPEEHRAVMAQAAVDAGVAPDDALALSRDTHPQGSIDVSHVAPLDVTPELLESMGGREEVVFGETSDPRHSVAALQENLAGGDEANESTTGSPDAELAQPSSDAPVTQATGAAAPGASIPDGVAPLADASTIAAAPEVVAPVERTPEEQMQALMADQTPFPCTKEKPPDGPAQAAQMPPQHRLGPFTPDQRANYLFHQMKRGIRSWYECHKTAIWTGIITAVVLIVIDLFFTGGTVSTTIMEVVGAIMIGVAIIRIAGLMAEFLAKAILGDVDGAGKALARALAAGAIEIVFALMFSAGALLKQVKNALQASVRVLGRVAPRTAAALTTVSKTAARVTSAAGRRARSVGKAAAAEAQRVGGAMVRRGRIILDGLPPGIARRIRSVGEFAERLWAYGRRSRLRFRRFKLQRAGHRLQLWGYINPWVLLADGTLLEVEDDAIRRTFGRSNVMGEPIDLGAGRRGIVIGDDLSRLRPAGRHEVAPGVRSTAPPDYPVLRVDLAHRPDVVPSGVILEFPGGHRVWRMRGGGIAHESHAGPAVGRAHLERDLPAPGEVGLRDQHRAHTLGQGTGFESPYAIPYAPSRVNLALQNDGIEELLRGLRDELPAGVIAHIRTETRFIPGTRRLDEIIYRIDVSHGGQSRRLLEFNINVGGTRTNPQISYGSSWVNPDPSAGGVLNVVDVPQRVADRLARIQAAIARRRTAATTVTGSVRRRAVVGGPSIDRAIALPPLRESDGESLDTPTRGLLQSQFDTDLSDVRIHRDRSSAVAADMLAADAFTAGRHIHFGEARYEPHTPAGLHLLAHELSHAARDRSDAGPATASVAVEPADTFAERRAEATADAVASGVNGHRHPPTRAVSAVGPRSAEGRPTLSHPANLQVRAAALRQAQQQRGNRAVQSLFDTGVARAKLRMGATHDPEERVADEIADRVMQSPSAAPCAVCETRAGHAGTVMRAPACAAQPAAVTSGAQLDHLANGGQQLSEPLREFFEPRFGTDLSDVRLHIGSDAQASAHALGAKAFASGSHIAFAAGEYEPETDEGRQLLAHEIAHIVRGGEPLRRQPDTDDRIGEVRSQLADGNEREAISAMRALSPTEVPRVLGDTELRALAVKVFGDKEMGEAILAMRGAAAPSLRWLFAEGCEWPEVGAWLRSQPTEIGAVLPDDTMREGFVDALGDEEMAEALLLLPGPLVRKIEWLRAEDAGFSEATKVIRAQPAEGATLYDRNDLRAWFVDICDDETMQQLVLLLGGRLRQKLGWMDAEDSNGGLIGEVVGKSEPSERAEILDDGQMRRFFARSMPDYILKHMLDLLGATLSQRVEWYNEAGIDEAPHGVGEAPSLAPRDVQLLNQLEGRLPLFRYYQAYEAARLALAATKMGVGELGAQAANAAAELAGLPSPGRTAQQRLDAAKAALDAELAAQGFKSIEGFLDEIRRFEAFFVGYGMQTALAMLADNRRVAAQEKTRYDGGEGAELLKLIKRATYGDVYYHLAINYNAFNNVALLKQSAGKYPILAHPDFYTTDMRDMVEAEDVAGFTAHIREVAEGVLENIEKTSRALLSDTDKLWQMDGVILQAKQALGIVEGSVYDALIKRKLAQIAAEETFKAIALAALAIGLGLLSGGTGAVAILAGAGALAISVGTAIENWNKYKFTSAAHGSAIDPARALTQVDPSALWLAVDVVGIFLDLGGFMGAMRRVAKPAEELARAGDAAALATKRAELESAAGSAAADLEVGRDIANADLFVPAVMQSADRKIARQTVIKGDPTLAKSVREAAPHLASDEASVAGLVALGRETAESSMRIFAEDPQLLARLAMLAETEPAMAKAVVSLRSGLGDEAFANVMRDLLLRRDPARANALVLAIANKKLSPEQMQRLAKAAADPDLGARTRKIASELEQIEKQAVQNPASERIIGEPIESLQKGEARVTVQGRCKICSSPCQYELDMAREVLDTVRGSKLEGYAANLARRVELLDSAMEAAAARGTLRAEYPTRFAAAHRQLAGEVSDAHRVIVGHEAGVRLPAAEEIAGARGWKEGLFDDPSKFQHTTRLEQAGVGTAYHDRIPPAIVRDFPPDTAFTENTIQEYLKRQGVERSAIPTRSTGIDLYILDNSRNVIVPVDLTHVAGSKSHVAKAHRDVEKMRAGLEKVGLHLEEPIEIEYVGRTFDEAAAAIAAELRAYAKPPAAPRGR